MSLALLLARLLLAAVFLVAGIAKLADLAGSRQALCDFGVPAQLSTPLGVLLPLAELAVAVALLLPATAWWGAMGALALLLLFVGGIGYNLARGRQPDCHCFGQLHSAPAGWPTLLRNLVLATIAGLVVVFGRNSPGLGLFDWLAALPLIQRLEVVAGLVAVALLLGEGWLLWQVMTQHGRLLLRLEALEAERASTGRELQPAATESPAPAAAGYAEQGPKKVNILPIIIGAVVVVIGIAVFLLMRGKGSTATPGKTTAKPVAAAPSGSKIH